MADSGIFYLTLIAGSLVLLGAFGLGLCALDRRDERRLRALLVLGERLSAPGNRLAVSSSTGRQPAQRDRGLQRLPTTAFPRIVRRVVDVTRDPETPFPPVSAERGAIIDVDLSVNPADDTTRGRWLRHVLRAPSSAPAPAPSEDRGLQRLRLVRADESAAEEDTPAPDAQRAPTLPPPTSSPSRPSWR